MKNKLKIILPYPPSNNKIYQPIIAYNKRGKAYPSIAKTPVARLYEKQAIPAIRKAIKKQGWKKPVKGKKINMWIECYMPSASNDSSNSFKLLVDTFSKAGAWIDDNVVIVKTADFYIQNDGAEPCVKIIIEEADSIGVFKSQEHLDNFLNNNCKLCKKWNIKNDAPRCGIYTKLLDNKTQKEVHFKKSICRAKLDKEE
jgi:Holliday junction resolvase RusA-like endonuclease